MESYLNEVIIYFWGFLIIKKKQMKINEVKIKTPYWVFNLWSFLLIIGL